VFADIQEQMEEEEVFADVDVQELMEEEEVFFVELEVVEVDLDGQKIEEEQMECRGWIQLQSVADQAGDQAVAGAAT